MRDREMRCFICFDELDLTEATESVLCSGHGCHTECLYLWHQTRNSCENELSACILCKDCLPESGAFKLSSFTTKHQKYLLLLAENDDLRNFVDEFGLEIAVSEEFFLRLVTSSLKPFTFQVARFLKQYEVKNYNKTSKGKFALQLFLSISKNSNHLLWVLGNFDIKDLSLEITNNDLSEPLVCMFEANEAYLELYWVYREIFSNLSEDLQIRVGSVLYKANRSGIWTPYEAKIHPYQCIGMFLSIANRHKDQFTNIKRKVVPMILLNNFEIFPSIPASAFYGLYRQCDEIWTLIGIALRYQNVKFLGALLSYHHWNRRVSISYYKLAVQIRESGIYDDARRLLEKYCIFDVSLMWKVILKYFECKEKGKALKLRLFSQLRARP